MEWSARVEWSTPEPYTVDDVDELITNLEAQFPAIAREADAARSGGSETWSAQIWLEADDFRRGFDEAVRLVEGATGLPVTGIELLDWATFDLRVGRPDQPR
jgi:hypothetical protein